MIIANRTSQSLFKRYVCKQLYNQIRVTIKSIATRSGWPYRAASGYRIEVRFFCRTSDYVCLPDATPVEATDEAAREEYLLINHN